MYSLIQSSRMKSSLIKTTTINSIQLNKFLHTTIPINQQSSMQRQQSTRSSTMLIPNFTPTTNNPLTVSLNNDESSALKFPYTNFTPTLKKIVPWIKEQQPNVAKGNKTNK